MYNHNHIRFYVFHCKILSVSIGSESTRPLQGNFMDSGNVLMHSYILLIMYVNAFFQ